MDDILQKFTRWLIGFGAASAVYLVIALWLIRGYRLRREKRQTLEKSLSGGDSTAGTRPANVSDRE